MKSDLYFKKKKKKKEEEEARIDLAKSNGEWEYKGFLREMKRS
jgi:hypothetical protein